MYKNRIKIGINGFGRIGRTILKSSLQSNNNKIQIVAINNPSTSPEYLAHLLQYDTCLGSTIDKFSNLKVGEDFLQMNDAFGNPLKIQLYRYKDPQDIPWQGVDYVIDSTGLFNTYELLSKHIRYDPDNGVRLTKGIIITSPTSDPKIPTYVMGVNNKNYNPESDQDLIISNASCTTNCAGPFLKLIQEKYGIQEAYINTIHSSTSSQFVVDKSNEKNWRIARSALQNIIPSTTGASKALTKVIPELKGKIIATSVRVPTINVSLLDLTIRTEQKLTLNQLKEDINEINKAHISDCDSSELNSNIMSFTEDQVVSSDLNGNNSSGILDIGASLELNDNCLKLMIWYDNEWAYSNRILDLIKYIS